MLIKTSELTGAALDWAVAKCEGIDVELISARMITERRHVNLTPEEVASLPAPKPYLVVPGTGNAAYSTDWAQGGPIIEREKIDRIATNVSGGFTASKKIVDLLDDDSFNVRWVHGSGSTLLIAAMRCYVASKLGDTVEIPDELFV